MKPGCEEVTKLLIFGTYVKDITSIKTEPFLWMSRLEMKSLRWANF